jgi:hypothetical protein
MTMTKTIFIYPFNMARFTQNGKVSSISGYLDAFVRRTIPFPIMIDTKKKTVNWSNECPGSERPNYY